MEILLTSYCDWTEYTLYLLAAERAAVVERYHLWADDPEAPAHLHADPGRQHLGRGRGVAGRTSSGCSPPTTPASSPWSRATPACRRARSRPWLRSTSLFAAPRPSLCRRPGGARSWWSESASPRGSRPKGSIASAGVCVDAVAVRPAQWEWVRSTPEETGWRAGAGRGRGPDGCPQAARRRGQALSRSGCGVDAGGRYCGTFLTWRSSAWWISAEPLFGGRGRRSGLAT